MTEMEEVSKLEFLSSISTVFEGTFSEFFEGELEASIGVSLAIPGVRR